MAGWMKVHRAIQPGSSAQLSSFWGGQGSLLGGHSQSIAGIGVAAAGVPCAHAPTWAAIMATQAARMRDVSRRMEAQTSPSTPVCQLPPSGRSGWSHSRDGPKNVAAACEFGLCYAAASKSNLRWVRAPAPVSNCGLERMSVSVVACPRTQTQKPAPSTTGRAFACRSRTPA